MVHLTSLLWVVILEAAFTGCALLADATNCICCLTLLVLGCTKLTEHHEVLGFCTCHTCVCKCMAVGFTPLKFVFVFLKHFND